MDRTEYLAASSLKSSHVTFFENQNNINDHIYSYLSFHSWLAWLIGVLGLAGLFTTHLYKRRPDLKNKNSGTAPNSKTTLHPSSCWQGWSPPWSGLVLPQVQVPFGPWGDSITSRSPPMTWTSPSSSTRRSWGPKLGKMRAVFHTIGHFIRTYNISSGPKYWLR